MKKIYLSKTLERLIFLLQSITAVAKKRFAEATVLYKSGKQRVKQMLNCVTIDHVPSLTDEKTRFGFSPLIQCTLLEFRSIN